jgi:hypothetical protein
VEEIVTLTPKHVNDICLLNHSDKSRTCRYLLQDDLQDGKWYCQKLRPIEKDKIDARLDKVQNRNFGNIPSGDNCSGYPLLKHVEQGYDVD